jgi:hypothetical protein
MKQLKMLLKMEEGPNQAARLAVKLGVSESYIRMLLTKKATAGWRLKRDIETLYNKEEENVG